MATKKWVTVEQKWCAAIGQEVALLALRVYPNERLPDTLAYQVAARKCSADTICNLLDVPCQWAYTAPGCDRFHLD